MIKFPLTPTHHPQRMTYERTRISGPYGPLKILAPAESLLASLTNMFALLTKVFVPLTRKFAQLTSISSSTA